MFLDGLLVGFEHLEKTAISLAAMGRPIMLIGRQGTGKTLFGKILASAICPTGKIVLYDCSKENLISVVGIPSPEHLKKGELFFVSHERSIFNADYLILDEISRSSRETQNIWLSVLWERKVYGQTLRYRGVVATSNPESFAATIKIDEALMDRFYAVLPMEGQYSTWAGDKFAHMVEMNMGGRAKSHIERLSKDVTGIRAAAKEAKEELNNNYLLFAARAYPFIAKHFLSANKFISGRVFAKLLPETIMGLIGCSDYLGITRAKSVSGCIEDALTYVINTRYGMNIPAKEIAEIGAVLLKSGKLSAWEIFKTIETLEGRYHFIIEHLEEIKNWDVKKKEAVLQMLEDLLMQNGISYHSPSGGNNLSVTDTLKRFRSKYKNPLTMFPILHAIRLKEQIRGEEDTDLRIQTIRILSLFYGLDVGVGDHDFRGDRFYIKVREITKSEPSQH